MSGVNDITDPFRQSIVINTIDEELITVFSLVYHRFTYRCELWIAINFKSVGWIK